MILMDVRVGLRQLASSPAGSAIALLGLAIAIATSYLVGCVIEAAVLPDPEVPSPSELVRLEFRANIPGRDYDWDSGAPFALRDALLQAKAPVLSAARVMDEDWSLRAGEKIIKVKGIFADPDITTMFGSHAIQGNIEAALQRPDGIVLTEETALRLFGNETGLGHQLSFRGQTLTVTAITKTWSPNPALKFDAIIKFDSTTNTFPQQMRGKWYMVAGRVFARLTAGGSDTQLTRTAQALFDDSPGTRETPSEWSAGGRKTAFMRAVSIDRVALHGAGSSEYRVLLVGLAAAALAVLTLAASNYLNLTTLRTLSREREIGIRKSIGASPGRITVQFLGESIVFAVVAGMVGLGLARLIAPTLERLVERDLQGSFFSPSHLIALLFVCLILGLVTGFYPAYVASSVNSAQALAGRGGDSSVTGRWLRRVLTIVQTAAAVGLTTVAIVVIWQGHFMSHLDRGFVSAGLYAIDLPSETPPPVVDAFRNALAREEGVLAATTTEDVLGRAVVGPMATLKVRDVQVFARRTAIDRHFFDVHNIPMLAGAVLDSGSSGLESPVVLDETAASTLGFANPRDAIGQTVAESRKGGDRLLRVVGVVGPIRQEPLRSTAAPQYFVVSPAPGTVITFRTEQKVPSRPVAEMVWNRFFPNDVIEIGSVDGYLDKHYKQDKTFGALSVAACALSLILAGLGIYALAAYTARARTREIAIRKLYGASNGAIALLLIREFGTLLAVGAVIGAPIGWLASNYYMSGLQLRAPIGPWALLAACAIVIVVASLAILRHTLAAIGTRPALALRSSA